MREDLHIVWLTPGFAKDEQDTSCIPVMQSFFKAFHEKYSKARLSIIALQYPYCNDEYCWNGINVHPCNGRGSKLYRFQTWKKARHYFQQINSESKVDIIHSFWFNEAALLGNKWSKKTSIPHICTLMGQDALPKNRYLKLVNKKNPTLVALSDNHAKTFEKTTGKQIDAIIPFGIEISTKAPSFNSRTIDILGAGALTKLKNYSLFVACISKLKNTFPNIKAVIAGDGPKREELQQQINAAGLQENIELKGHIPRDEVLQLMENSKIFLHTSTYESFGFVYSEALSKGQYVVSFNVGNTIDTPQWKITSSEKEMVEQLQLLLAGNRPPPEQMVHHSIDNTLSSYADLYEKLLTH